MCIAGVTTLVSLYGYVYVHRYERYAWIPMTVIFLIILVTAAPNFHITSSAKGIAEVASFMSFGGAVYGFAQDGIHMLLIIMSTNQKKLRLSGSFG